MKTIDAIEWRTETHDVLPSTQNLVKERTLQGEAQGLVVRALEQTSGRGRHGRIWAAGEGNLYFSLLLRPNCKAAQIGQISLLTGLSLHEALEEMFGLQENIMLKWPNDILIERKKCCGILLEAEPDTKSNIGSLVIGIGLNVHSTPIDGACCLADYYQNLPDPEFILQTILRHISKNYKKWQSEGFDAMRGDWMVRANTKGERLSVKVGQRIHEGVFDGLDQDGNLMLIENNHKTPTKITGGDVFLLSGEGERNNAAGC